MLKQVYKKDTTLKIINSTFIDLPAPSNISTMWNIGSILRMCLVIQILSGLILATSYTPRSSTAFELIFKNIEITRKTWIIRSLHANGASLFFVCLYIHTARGLYYSSFTKKQTWAIGVTILLTTMATAFVGYVLPFNQISFWGASVITNLFSEVPYIGPDIVNLIWGGMSVSDPTLTRFFTLHFTLPILIVAMVIIHITLLHKTGSSNPLGVNSKTNKLAFRPPYAAKDIIGLIIILTLFLLINLYKPIILGDNENFTNADPSLTPQHIQPEWYFLFAYAILRSIPNKLGGIIALVYSIIILYTLPYIYKAKKKRLSIYPLNKLIFWSFTVVVYLLTWVGMRPVEQPYVLSGQALTVIYFSYFYINSLTQIIWDK